MNRVLIALPLMAALATQPAFAWDYIQNGGGQQIGDGATGTQNNNRASSRSNANAKASSNSFSNSSSSAKGGSARASGGNVSIGSVGSGSGSGGGYVGAITTPDGYGNAPCGGGIGLGGGGGFGGGSGGGTLWEFSDCKRMRESSALRALGYPDAALAELCQIDRVKEAFGGTCPTHEVQRVTTTDAGPYDYCFTRDAGDRNQHKECDDVRKVRK